MKIIDFLLTITKIAHKKHNMEYQIHIKNAGGNLTASAYPPYQS